MLKKVYLVENNWGEESSINVFRTKRSAIKNFKAQVLEQLEPGLLQKEYAATIRKAVKDERFDYSGSGDSDDQPYIVIDSYPVQE